MQDYYFLDIAGRPVPKSNVYGVRVIGSGKSARGMIYTTKELEDYEMMVGKIANDIIPETINAYASLYMRVYQHGKRWIDVDNCFKAIQDGLDATKIIKRGKKEIQVCNTGIANDKYFQLIVGERIHVESAEEQRIELIITEYAGLFNLVDVVKNHYGIEEDYYKELFLPEI
jgi:Holliday junction resolvase RusA-like endonuclease